MNTKAGTRRTNDVHSGEDVLMAGASVTGANAAVIAIHGRGASAQSIISFAQTLVDSQWALYAPQAYNNSWYPYSFLAPPQQNQPFLDSALMKLETVFQTLIDSKIPEEKIVLVGFSQGACLALEFAARKARRIGGIIALSGGLIGSTIEKQNYSGSFGGTPAFLGSSDPDSHVPFERVAESAKILAEMQAQVSIKRYPGMAHSINEEEISLSRQIMQSVTAS